MWVHMVMLLLMMMMADGHDDNGDGDGDSDSDGNLGSLVLIGCVVIFVSWAIVFKYALYLPSISDQFNAHCRPDWG